VGFFKKSTSAIGKLVLVVLLAGAFLAGMAGVIVLSLQGTPISVPEIVGKNFNDSEKELNDLGLKIKKRADRYSEEAPGTILEQLPKSGETVKPGQMILVVISKANSESGETPATIKKDGDTDDSEKIEDLISDKPKKKTNSNTNTKKKGSTTRDVLGNTTTNSSSTGDGSGDTNSNKSTTNPANKSTNPGETKKPGDTTKPTTNKTPKPR
jgi:serine/threonine-protein kinase